MVWYCWARGIPARQRVCQPACNLDGGEDNPDWDRRQREERAHRHRQPPHTPVQSRPCRLKQCHQVTRSHPTMAARLRRAGPRRISCRSRFDWPRRLTGLSFRTSFAELGASVNTIARAIIFVVIVVAIIAGLMWVYNPLPENEKTPAPTPAAETTPAPTSEPEEPATPAPASEAPAESTAPEQPSTP